MKDLRHSFLVADASVREKAESDADELALGVGSGTG
jgi:hypothetical protein